MYVVDIDLRFNFFFFFLDSSLLTYLIFKLMFNLDKVHLILDEMVMNGCIVETNKSNVLAAVSLYDT